MIKKKSNLFEGTLLFFFNEADYCAVRLYLFTVFISNEWPIHITQKITTNCNILLKKRIEVSTAMALFPNSQFVNLKGDM